MPQSPELAGGAGHTFEDMVAARYLVALLGELGGPGIKDRVVSRVALQQRDFSEPLDDLIVDFRSPQDEARLSLQLKRSLTISAAANNKDFREVIRDSWLTLQKPDFRNDIDRYGAAAETTALGKRRDLERLCDLARASPSVEDFERRFEPSGNASDTVAAIRSDITALIADSKGSPPTPSEVHRFLRHFVLLVFDELADGATGPADAIALLTPMLDSGNVDRAPLVWDRLCALARAGASRARQFVRRDLVVALAPQVRLAGAQSLQKDLAALTEQATRAAADIEDGVDGTRLQRLRLRVELTEARERFRFVQVQGLPGSGKSVLLRLAIEEALDQGSVLFLKSDRLQGTSWPAYANSIGLSSASLEDLLCEIAATGTSTLFIDGIDRIEVGQRSIVLDLLRTIIDTAALEEWSIVATLRDTGVEHVRTWLPRSLFEANALGVVAVAELNEDEARALAESKPELEPLLFGPKAVREIVRRPFFAKILVQGFSAAPTGATFMPRSEVDLIDNWWLRGGYNAEGQAALNRQLALLDVAALQVRNLGEPVRRTELRADTAALIHQLVSDGILQMGRSNLTVRFAHDIYFEWTYFHALLGAGAGWIDELRAVGEPPMLGRIVDLLSQAAFRDGSEWAAGLHALERSKLRSQWLRAWLLGPIGSPAFNEHEERFLTVVSADDYHLLRRVLVWFQAERTIPNPNILRGEIGGLDMTLEARVRAADLLGWPSDFATWSRLIQILLRKRDDLPVFLRPHIAAIFEVWQHAFADLANEVSRALLAQAEEWLESLEERAVRMRAWRRSGDDEIQDDWKDLRGSTKELSSLLRRLLLRAARSEPEVARRYLARLSKQEQLDHEVISEVFAFSLLLAETHPVELVDVALAHMLEELPADKAARLEREAEISRARRDEARAKPESERTREDELAIAGMFSRIGHDSYSRFDWESLALDDNRTEYFPASPLREPFNALFINAPAEALRLVRELSNHAMEAWRQLYRLDWQREATPIPIAISFPWGTQRFWGTTREYLWSRGIWAPKALACAWLAAEDWAFRELEHGTPAEDLITQVIQDNESVACLGLALTIARQAECVADVVQPILESSRLWRADIQRAREELSLRSSQQIGFMHESDRPHAEAVDAINKRPVREGDIRALVGAAVLGTPNHSNAMREAIRRFADVLEFEFEEQRNIPELEQELSQFAASMSHWADLTNYHAVKAEESSPTEVYFVDPDTATPEAQARQVEARLALMEHTLFIWADKCLETGTINEMLSYPDALSHAHRLEGNETGQRDYNSVAWGGIAGVAAVALRFRDLSTEEERGWARSLLAEIARTPAQIDESWSSRSIIPWHAGIFAARGLAADLRAGEADELARQHLLALAIHLLDGVSLAALNGMLGLFARDSNLAWSALWLGFAICKLPPRTTPREEYAQIVAQNRDASLATAVTELGSGRWLSLPLPDEPWTFVAGAKPSRRRRRLPLEEDSEDELVDGGAWRPSPEIWDSQFAAKIIELIPVATFLADANAGQALRTFTGNILRWTIESIAPSWDKSGRDHERRRTDLIEWQYAFAKHLAHIAGHLPPDEAERDILAPILALQDEPCFELLAHVVDYYLRAYVLDPATVAPSAERLMSASLERLLAWPGFSVTSYRAGELHGFDLPVLVKALMFVAALNAPGASRFANGDWREISLILPIVDRFVRTAGWSVTVMYHFVTLLEHAKEAYPAELFASSTLVVLSLGDEVLEKWRGTLLAARLAGIVQMFADQRSPLPTELATSLLRILDILVDQGDRRSAALQLTEAFREIRLPPGGVNV